MNKWTDIVSFRELVTRVNRRADYLGVEPPTIAFLGRVKLHGTNGGVTLLPGNKIRAQSRERVLSLQSDNAGFAAFCVIHEEHLLDVMKQMEAQVGDTIYGEWIGPGINKGVAINKLPEKMFVVFGIKDKNGEHIPQRMFDSPHPLIQPINKAPPVGIKIDFKHPAEAAEKIQSLVTEYENQCPWGTLYNIEGIGEGLVFSPLWSQDMFLPYSDLLFKAKGDKHGNPATENAPKVSWTTEQVDSVNELISLVLPGWRLQQGLQHVPAVSKQHTGAYLAWINKDVLKEEQDRVMSCVQNAGLDIKFITSKISLEARKFFLAECDKV